MKLTDITNLYNENDKIIYSHSDSYETLCQIPDNSIKLIITSPPYNIGKEYEIKRSVESYLQTQTKIIRELTRVLTTDGSICWQVGNYINNGEVFPLDVFYYEIFKQNDLKLRNRIIWHFGHGLHAKTRFSGRYETILWFTKTNEYTFNLDNIRIPQKYPGKRHYKGKNKGKLSGNPQGKNPSDIWEFLHKEWDNEIWDIPNVKANHIEKTIHPCQFPVELVERCVLALSNEDDWVLDPFAGVASTIIGSIKNNRKGFGIEKEKKYIEIGVERINAFLKNELSTRPLGKKVYTPTGKEKVSQIPKEWQNQSL